MPHTSPKMSHVSRFPVASAASSLTPLILLIEWNGAFGSAECGPRGAGHLDVPHDFPGHSQVPQETVGFVHSSGSLRSY